MPIDTGGDHVSPSSSERAKELGWSTSPSSVTVHAVANTRPSSRSASFCSRYPRPPAGSSITTTVRGQVAPPSSETAAITRSPSRPSSIVAAGASRRPDAKAQMPWEISSPLVGIATTVGADQVRAPSVDVHMIASE